MMDDLSALVLTFNERENIARTLTALAWAKRVMIVDSGSTDGTIDLARKTRPDGGVVHRAFDTHAQQWNFGLDQLPTLWVLALDADYQLSESLVEEIQQLNPGEVISGYEAQ